MAMVPYLAATALTSAISAAAKTRKNRGKKMKSNKAVVLYDPKFAQRQSLTVRRKAKRPRGIGGSSTTNRLGFEGIPVSVASASTSTSWKFAGKAQKLADYDNDRSIKIVGSYTSPVISSLAATYPGLMQNFPAANSVTGWTVGLLTPRIDPRLRLFEELFSFYAFRKIRIRFVPQNAASTNAAANRMLAFGLSDSPDEAVAVGSGITASNSLQTISESFRALVVQSTGTGQMEYSFTGSRLWATSSDNEADSNEYAQLAILGAGTIAGTSSVEVYGYFFVDYELDLYRPSSVETNPALSKKDHKTESKDIQSQLVKNRGELLLKLALEKDANEKESDGFELLEKLGDAKLPAGLSKPDLRSKREEYFSAAAGVPKRSASSPPNK